MSANYERYGRSIWLLLFVWLCPLAFATGCAKHTSGRVQGAGPLSSKIIAHTSVAVQTREVRQPTAGLNDSAKSPTERGTPLPTPMVMEHTNVILVSLDTTTRLQFEENGLEPVALMKAPAGVQPPRLVLSASTEDSTKSKIEGQAASEQVPDVPEELSAPEMHTAELTAVSLPASAPVPNGSDLALFLAESRVQHSSPAPQSTAGIVVEVPAGQSPPKIPVNFSNPMPGSSQDPKGTQEDPSPGLPVTMLASHTGDAGATPKKSHFPRNVKKEPSRGMISRAERHIPVIIEALIHQGLPLELAYLPVVESAFEPSAVSPKGAAGLWQLMPATAVRFGLRVDSDVDERFCVTKSTAAAAAYLAYLHDRFRNWALALAAYNAGENRLSQAMSASGANSFTELTSLSGSNASSYLHRETMEFVPKFVAAVHSMHRRIDVELVGGRNPSGISPHDELHELLYYNF
jgi:hypothetical protein